MCPLRNIALESVTENCDRQTDRQTDRRTDGQTDGQTTDKVIPMCRYASQATQKVPYRDISTVYIFNVVLGNAAICDWNVHG